MQQDVCHGTALKGMREKSLTVSDNDGVGNASNFLH